MSILKPLFFTIFQLGKLKHNFIKWETEVKNIRCLGVRIELTLKMLHAKLKLDELGSGLRMSLTHWIVLFTLIKKSQRTILKYSHP